MIRVISLFLFVFIFFSCQKYSLMDHDFELMNRIDNYLSSERKIDIKKFSHLNIFILQNGNCNTCTLSNLETIQNIIQNDSTPVIIIMRKYEEEIFNSFLGVDFIYFDKNYEMEQYGILSTNDIYIHKNQEQQILLKFDGLENFEIKKFIK